MISNQPKIPIFKILIYSIKKLSPFYLFFNPALFVTEIAAILLMVNAIWFNNQEAGYIWGISIGLWITIFSANIADSMAELQSKFHAEWIKNIRMDIKAKVKQPDGSFKSVSSYELKKNDICLINQGDIIPADGQIIEGMASIDESSITGKIIPVIRSANSDNDCVIAGTKVLSDQFLLRVFLDSGESQLDQLIDVIEKRLQKKSQSELTLSFLLSSLTLLFLVVILSFQFSGYYYDVAIPLTSQIALLISLIPTTIAGLLNCISITGIARLFQKNIIALNSSSIESAGNTDIIIFDKTATLTKGDRIAFELIPSLEACEKDFLQACYLTSFYDNTSEGQSIIRFLASKFPSCQQMIPPSASWIPFCATTRLSGLDLEDKKLRKGAIDAIKEFTHSSIPSDLEVCIQRICEKGGSALLVASSNRILGVIFLKDEVKEELSEKMTALNSMGIETMLVTGDDKASAKAIAKEVSISKFSANLSAEDKANLVILQQQEGLVVGMVGDGINDSLALSKADLAVVMHSGSNMAKRSANMIDFDSNPGKLVDIIAISKQLIVTQGSITTFSIATDVAKYFILLPAILVDDFPLIASFSIVPHLKSNITVLSVVIFNAFIIISLIPISFKGVKMQSKNFHRTLNRNIVIYGVGGILFPFFAIKGIDFILRIFL